MFWIDPFGNVWITTNGTSSTNAGVFQPVEQPDEPNFADSLEIAELERIYKLPDAR